MMLKKTVFLLFLMFLPYNSFGNDRAWVNENGEPVSDEEVAEFIFDNAAEEAKRQALELEAVYEGMNTCMEAHSQYLEIFGFEGNLCHFKYSDYDCFVPQNVAAEYAELGLMVAEDMAKGIISTETKEAKRMQEILSDKRYCTYEMTWSVTMEDENGQEVPAEGIIFK